MRPTETLGIARLVGRIHAGARPRPERLTALQDRSLRSAVAHAYAEIPFYRELWQEHGVEPADVRGVADLGRLPILSPAAAGAATARGTLLSRRARPTEQPVLHTSGASGRSTAFACASGDRWLWWAFGMRTSLEHGIGKGGTTLRFDPHPPLPHPIGRFGVARTIWAPTDLPSGELLARCGETAPAVVAGTPTLLRRLCEAIGADGASLPRLRAVFAEGEILDAATRKAVVASLGVDPVSVYGLTEVGYVAWQCERREGFHLNAEAYVAEVLSNGRPVEPGELGALVVTDLRSRDRPLLRYDTGDLAIAGDGQCPCGRTLPLIASIEGRANGAVLLPDGRVVTSRAILNCLADAAAPGRYRLHQEAPDRIRIELVDSVVRDAVLPRLRALLGDVELQVQIGMAPAPSSAHKTHVVLSAVTPLRDCSKAASP